MSLRDTDRADQTFGVDDAVRRALSAWSRERDSDIGRLNLARAAERMSDEQRRQLVERLAEIALGLLFGLDGNPARPRGRGGTPGAGPSRGGRRSRGGP